MEFKYDGSKDTWVGFSFRRSGKIEQDAHRTLNKDVEFVKDIINDLTENNNSTNAKKIFSEIIERKGLNITEEEFYGRRKDYHTYYFYPMKVLEYLHYIEYRKKGEIIRCQTEYLKQSIPVRNVN